VRRMGRVGGDLAQAQDCSSLFFYFYTFPFISNPIRILNPN
jgi:hypothetical protein